jgi:FdrA protein
VLYSIVKRNSYQDSLRLMHLSTALGAAEGVGEVSVMMGTPANKDVLRAAGLVAADLDDARPTDLVIAAEVDDAAVGEALVAKVDELLARQVAATRRSGLRTARSLERAIGLAGEPNLALVSIPGEYVAPEVRRLLERDIHAFVFSDNVSVEDEVALKRLARERGLLMMGPDCGTGSIGGLPLAFANEVHAGAIGLVGASGTGLQEVMTQIDRLGGGVSHAIGLGGRDLGAAVGGIACLQGLEALHADEATDVIVLVGKPPAPGVRDEVLGVARTLSKPVVAHLVGEADVDVHGPRTLAETARVAVELAGPRAARRVTLRPGQRRIVGLYAGGTLAAEAAALLPDAGHEVIDLGDDRHTRGRPHPMIDPSSRTERIPAVLADPDNAVLLLDVVLGHGAHPDPAGALTPVIADGLAGLRAQGRDLAVVASVCGSDADPQSAGGQARALREAGVAVLPDNAAAVRHALAILHRGDRQPRAATTPSPIAELLAGPPRIVNIGLRDFAETLHDRGAQVVHYDWAPVAGGDRRLQALLEALN